MVSNLIISESVTLVGSLGSGKNGKAVYNYITDNCRITHTDQDICDRPLKPFLSMMAAFFYRFCINRAHGHV